MKKYEVLFVIILLLLAIGAVMCVDLNKPIGNPSPTITNTPLVLTPHP
jgi:hypothetical protein